MRDALGGYFNLTMLIGFIVLVTALIALSLNFTKAYRVKNKVISYIEKYEGNIENEDMLSHTYDDLMALGYNGESQGIYYATETAKNAGWTCPDFKGRRLGWCYQQVSSSKVKEGYVQYNVAVFINSHLPFIWTLFSQQFLWMKGTTTAIPVFK